MSNIVYQTKKAEYRFKELFGNVAASRLTETKATVSNRLGISIAQLNRIIRGESDPSGTQLLIIADSFGLTVSDLYYSKESSSTAQTGAFE